jgi:uncharacterized membrane protein
MYVKMFHFPIGNVLLLYLVLCFYSMYHWTLFEYGYLMTDANFKNFQIIKTIDSNEIGWALRYMINQTNNLDPEQRPKRLINQGEFIGLLILCAILFIISLIAIRILIRSYRKHEKSWDEIPIKEVLSIK